MLRNSLDLVILVVIFSTMSITVDAKSMNVRSFMAYYAVVGGVARKNFSEAKFNHLFLLKLG